MKEKNNIYIFFLNIFTLQVWSSDEILDSLAQTGGETLNNSIPVKTKKTFMHTAVGSIKSITYGWGGSRAKSRETDG